MISKESIFSICLVSSSLCFTMDNNFERNSLIIAERNKILSDYKQQTKILQQHVIKNYAKVASQNMFTNLEEKSEYDEFINFVALNKPTTKPSQPATEIEQLSKIVAEKNAILQKTLETNKKLQNNVEDIKQKIHTLEKEITSKQNNSTHKKQEVFTKKTHSKKNKKNHTKQQQQQTVTVTVPNNDSSTLPTFTKPTINPTTKDLQKKRALLKILFKRYNVKSEDQLKSKLAQECIKNESYGVGSFLNGCIWEYLLKQNTLVINTDAFREVKDNWEDID